MLLHNHGKSTQKKLSISYHDFYWYKKNEDKFKEMTLNLWLSTLNIIKNKKKQLRTIW